jgi:hypothetical protein
MGAARTAKRSPKKVDLLNVNHPGAGTRISQEKYDIVSAAILAVVPKVGSGVELRRLSGMVKARLSTRERDAVGSLDWYVTTVKLDLEARGRIERVPDVTPQRLRRVL